MPPIQMKRTLGLIFVFVLVVLPSCGRSSSSSGPSSHHIVVVAAENFWGSIARQEAGSRATVDSIIVNPNADPHAYEPTAADARLVATANLFIFNGVGYDPWAQKLVAANPVSSRRVVEIANYVKPVLTNPHLWYDPSFVKVAANRITRSLIALDPKGSAYFIRLHRRLLATGLAQYHKLIAQIAHRFKGAPVGATESIFAYMAPAIHLRLITPYSFMKDIAEGAEPTASDKATFDRQIAQRQIRVLVFNKQNTTPDVNALLTEAKARHIPVVPITETLSPASSSFQAWQTNQLRDLYHALST